MAAKSEIALTRVVDLRHLRASDLESLLSEEVAMWRQMLRWDFRPSAELVRRFVDMQALSGYALMRSEQVIGYVYYVCEERKGLIGDLYVLESDRSVEAENALLERAIAETDCSRALPAGIACSAFNAPLRS